MKVSEAVDILNQGGRLNVQFGADHEEPVRAFVYTSGETVMAEMFDGWSAGMVEPVTGKQSDYLYRWLENAHEIELAR